MSITFPAFKVDEKERRKILIAIAVSLVIHLFLIGSVTIAYTLNPVVKPPEKKEEKPPELTFIAPPPSLPKLQSEYIDTTSSDQANKPPEKPAFESDKDTRAASSAMPSGPAPLPSQEGEKSPGIEFETKEYTPGKQSGPTAASGQTQPEATAPEAAATPEPMSTPQPTPRQTAQLALLEPPKQQSTPKPTPTQRNTPTPQKAETRPANPSPPGFQPQTRITRIKGNISNRGRSSVDAIGTPLGRYKKMVSDAIGSRWYYYVNQQIGVLNVGTVAITFIVESDGKVSKVEVMSNTSNESFATCSLQAIIDAEIPPIPEQLSPMLEGNRLQIDYTFTILGN